MSVSSFVQRSLEKKIKPPDPTPWKGDTKSHCYETPATCHTSRSKKGDNTGCRHPRREQVRQRQGLETSAPLWAAARSIQHDSKNSGYFPSGPVVRISASNAAAAGSIPGRGDKIPHAAGRHQKKKKKKNSRGKKNGGDGMEIRVEDQEAMSR